MSGRGKIRGGPWLPIWAIWSPRSSGPRSGEVVFQPNVTLSHAVMFSAVRFSAARNKIVTDAMHFPSILYLIDEQRKCSATVDVVPSHDGITVDTNELLDRIDEHTAIVNISHVLFKSAYIHDVAAIAEKARRVGAMTVIDGYQAVGTIPVDVCAAGRRCVYRRMPEMALRRPRCGVPLGRPDGAGATRASNHRLDGASASLRLRAHPGPPCRRLAATERNTEHSRAVRGKTGPARDQRCRHPGDS